MELWEVAARESIRDVVTRYNANADTARYDQVMECFADDSVMTVPAGEYRGKAEILTIFTGATDHLRSNATESTSLTYVRHHIATHQIDLIDDQHAKGRCYFNVITPIGLDHWGRYLDEYRVVDSRWIIWNRRVTVDGQMPNSLFPASTGDPRT